MSGGHHVGENLRDVHGVLRALFRAPVRLVDLLLDDLVLERPVGERVDRVEIHVVVGEECLELVALRLALHQRRGRRVRQPQRHAERRGRADALLHLRHVGGERRPHVAPRCRRDAPASNRSGGRGRCRGPLFSRSAVHATFSTLPLAAERIIASLTEAPWMICSGGMGKGGPPSAARGERLEGGADDVELLGLPRLQRSLDRLELAGAELPRAPLLRRGAGDVGDALEPVASPWSRTPGS